jgi:hypothetical protein
MSGVCCGLQRRLLLWRRRGWEVVGDRTWKHLGKYSGWMCVGCVAGAMLVDEMRALAHHAGLRQLRLEAKSDYIDAMTDWQDPLYLKIVAALPEGARVSDFVTSLNVTAVKP